jgi:transcriptional regulator with XRE-family HTH domain
MNKCSTAERIRELRITNHMTQLELAQRADLERKAISRYESGLNTPGGKALATLAQIFSVSADYLLCLTDDPTPSPLLESELSPLEREVVMTLRRFRSEEDRRRFVDEIRRFIARAEATS